MTGLATAQLCAGAGIFFQETFNGNGRTCGSCHPGAEQLHDRCALRRDAAGQRPAVRVRARRQPDEPGDRFAARAGGILENVDGFEDPTHKFVDPVGAAHAGARDQHHSPIRPTRRRDAARTADRVGRRRRQPAATSSRPRSSSTTPGRCNVGAGVDFRTATTQELQLVQQFQLALGRMNELDFSQVNVFDAQAQAGKAASPGSDARALPAVPRQRRRELCRHGQEPQLRHGHASRPERSVHRPFFDGVALFDGGFGGKGLHPTC